MQRSRSSNTPSPSAASEGTPIPASATTRREEGSTLLLGGAQADFVASLGRKVAELEKLIATTNPGTRDELRRKLHALGSAAKSLKMEPLERTIGEALGRLDQVPREEGRIGFEGVEREEIHRMLLSLKEVAWGEPTKSRELTPAAEPMRPHALLVFGDDPIAKSLETRSPFAANASKDVRVALAMASERTPSLVVVDGDLPGAAEFVEALLDGADTADVPVLALGTFAERQAEGAFLALGVARTVQKPVDPMLLRRICHEMVAVKDETHTERLPLGEPTLERMVSLLENEFRRALLDGAVSESPAIRIPLGEGAEVLGALWSAISRIREVVSARSGGKIRWSTGPEGAYALAASMQPEGDALGRAAGGSRARDGEGRDDANDVSLRGRVVVVADDDPAVTWYLADLLRQAGCIVHEAFDGEAALALCEEHVPDLLISDILMPKRDGFSLCRRMKRDLALRDTAVILLSWKEDLLQRVRELGADARGYLRKETQSPAILARVREVLRNRDRFEARMRSEEGEIRGRLDGTSVHRLFQLVAATRANARISVRDATLLFEVELRDGRPVRAVKSSGNGRFERGARAFAEVLGVSAGRFVVAKSDSLVDAELTGTLEEQLHAAVAKARHLMEAVSGTALLDVEHVRFDEDALRSFLDVAPPNTRELLQELHTGGSPSDLLFAKRADGAALETLLLAMASRAILRDVEVFAKDEALAQVLEPSQLVGRVALRNVDEELAAEADAFFSAQVEETACAPAQEESPGGQAFAALCAGTKVMAKVAPVVLNHDSAGPRPTLILVEEDPFAVDVEVDFTHAAPPVEFGGSPDAPSVTNHVQVTHESLGDGAQTTAVPSPATLILSGETMDDSTFDVPVVSKNAGYETPPLGHAVALIESPTCAAELRAAEADLHVQTSIDATLYGGVDVVAANSGPKLPMTEPSTRDLGLGRATTVKNETLRSL